MIVTSRRRFLIGASAICAMPAVIRADALIPARTPAIWRPRPIPEWCPPGMLPCDGRVLPRADYPDLFRVIGTMYGSDTPGTFRLPIIPGCFRFPPVLPQQPIAGDLGHVVSLFHTVIVTAQNKGGRVCGEMTWATH